MRRASFILTLMALLVLAGCATAPANIDPTPTPVPTAVKPTFTVQRGDIVIQTDLGGRVVPTNSKPVSFAMDGDVGNVYVQVGDHVEAGQLLADLAVLKDLEAQWGELSAQANYEETISNNSLKRAEIKLQIAQLTVDDLKAKNATATAIQIAELQAQLAQMDLDDIKANPTLHTSANKVKAIERSMVDAQLKAPFAGYVLEAPNSGRAVKTTAPAFQIGDISQLEIGATVMDEVLKQLTQGMPVTVRFEGHADWPMYVGKISSLPYPYGEGTQKDQIRVTLTTLPPDGLQLGDRVLVTVELQHKQNVLWLPPQAIRTVGTRTLVVVQDAQGQQRVDVTLGLQTHDRVEIAAGLSDGQVIVGP